VLLHRLHIPSGAAALLLACAHGGRGQARSQVEHSLISAVIIQTIDRLPGAADSVYLATAPTRDSAQVLFRSMWASWWHTARQNGVKLPPSTLGRFAQQFNTKSPPPDPHPEVPSRYVVRELRVEHDSSTADIGPPYAGCKYKFARRGREWVVVGDPMDCWIS
jgi:hypothetical protein